MSDLSSTQLADGLAVQRIVPFGTTAELGELLAEATSNDQPVIPFGGRGSLGTGNPTTSPLAVDMTTNAGVISYTPADLTLSVRTGTTWAELQSTLAERGQALPLDVPNPQRTTVGGLVATGFAGPRKYRFGSMRDLLIGCEYVRGDGLVANAGGMVVKNVSGFEIPRFLHGSWGALAVITSINLKVLPRARAEATVLQLHDTIEAAITAGLDLVRSGFPVDAITVVTQEDAVTLATRVSGRSRAVQEMATQLAASASGDARRLEEDESTDWWQRITNAFAEGPDVVQVAISTSNDQLTSLAQELRESLPDGSMSILPGSGSLRVRFPISDGTASSATLSEVIDGATRLGATWVVESAPPSLRQNGTNWGMPDPGLQAMQAVKLAFDPGNILNRGRLFI